MFEFMKNTPLYPLFLRLRTRRFAEDRLRTQLMKRGHSLDKQNTENLPGGIFLFEVEVLLREWTRRGLPADETVRWVWGLVYKARFREGFQAPQAAATAPANLDEVAKPIQSRRSVRKWTSEPVGTEEIQAAVDAAQWAPSSCNRQPWHFLALSSQEDIDFMTRFTAQSFFRRAPLVLAALVDTTVYGADETHFAYLDLGAAIQNLLLTLHAEGLGACWLGVKHKSGFDENAEAFRRRFDLEARYKLVSFIAVGHPAGHPPAPPRKPLEAILRTIRQE